MERLRRRLRPLRIALTEMGGLVWLCFLPLNGVVLITLVITGVPQGVDLTAALTRATALNKGLTELSYLYYLLCVSVAVSLTLAHLRVTYLSRLIAWWITLAAALTAVPLLIGSSLGFGMTIGAECALFVLAWVVCAWRRVPPEDIPALGFGGAARAIEVGLLGLGIIICVVITIPAFNVD